MQQQAQQQSTSTSGTSQAAASAPSQRAGVQLKAMGYAEAAAALSPSLQKKASNFGNTDPRNQIATLHPLMQEKVRKLIDEAHQRGLDIWLFEGMRSIERQNDLYAQGRTKPGKKVTWVQGGGSYHNYGLAGDFVFHGGSGPWGEEHDWSALGAAGEAAGLKWGGSFGDRPHFQIKGITIAQLKAWHAQGGMDHVWSQVSGGGGTSETPSGEPENAQENEQDQQENSTDPGGSYTVKSGDTLGGIAQRLLGSHSRWTEIAAANNISDPRKLRVGQLLNIPGTQQESGGNTESAPEPAPTGRDYVVQRGDTLGGIAYRLLGSWQRWPEIAKANNISNPRNLSVGQVLHVPGATPAPQTQQPENQQPENQQTQQPETQQPETQQPENQQPESTSETESSVTTAPGQLLVTDPNALLRHAPPNLGGNGQKIPVGTKVTAVETVQKNGSFYVRVQEVMPEGQAGPPRMLGWTARTNLSGYEGGGGPKDYDAAMTTDDPIQLTGLSGVDRQMAIIYNGKGRFLKEQADALGIPVSVAAAVLKAESGGKGFAADDRMIIRFENHIFYDKWGQGHAQTFQKHFKYNSDKRWTGHKYRQDPNGAWQTCHTGQNREYEVLEFARGLADEAALQSISMGAAQIMGFNYAGQGYSSAREMYDDFKTAIRPQLDGLFTFIKNKPACINGLKEGNYVKFATGYNGKGQAQAYANIILGAKAAFERVAKGRKFA